MMMPIFSAAHESQFSTRARRQEMSATRHVGVRLHRVKAMDSETKVVWGYALDPLDNSESESLLDDVDDEERDSDSERNVEKRGNSEFYRFGHAPNHVLRIRDAHAGESASVSQGKSKEYQDGQTFSRPFRSFNLEPSILCGRAEGSWIRFWNMATKTRAWISLWFLLTAPVIVWDATYCFMRPRSMVGGDLHWIWEPYTLYQDIDYVYGIKALQENNGFTNAQSLLNIIETLLNLTYLYYAHILQSPQAVLIGFSGALMTLSKTVLYWMQEYYCGGCAVGHNSLQTLFLLWVVPNGLWLLFPGLIVYRLGKDIAASLHVASRIEKNTSSAKKR